jgi:hypothetical protein
MLSAASTCLLAEKKNMAAEEKAGKILRKLERQALNGRLTSETRKHAVKCCRIVANHSNTEWLVRLAKSVKRCVQAAAKAAEKDWLP